MGNLSTSFNICFSGRTQETHSFYFDNFSGFDYPLYTYDDALVSPDEGNEEPEEGEEPNDVVSDNEVDQEEPEEEPEEEEEEEEEETSVSGNETVSDNESSGSVSNNSVSDNSVSDNNVDNSIDYESISGNIIVNVDTHLQEYMPTVIDILTIIGGLIFALVVFELLKYIYKFFRIFF